MIGHVKIVGFKVADNRDSGIEIQEAYGTWGGPIIKVQFTVECLVFPCGIESGINIGYSNNFAYYCESGSPSDDRNSHAESTLARRIQRHVRSI